MPIYPLPQFEADLKADAETYAALKPPSSIVVRFGAVRMIGEFAYDGDAKPGCGSKLVARTHRGTELCEMLTSTCPNSGCGKSVSRKEMLEYIDNSGGRDYPYFSEGRILRVATVEDMNKQAALDAAKHQHVVFAREAAARVGLAVKVVDAEEILGGERMTFYYASEERIDFRPLVMELAARYHTRIEMKQVGSRDEARLTADYEKCGQHCCCKQFLKVLKPISMKNAKIQKATLDPLKISGRCGRLMCCLRYEESTYDDLRKRLPKKKTVVTTPDGTGIVIDTQILTQLVLVRLDATNEDAAYPIENIVIGVQAPNAGADDEDDTPTEGEATAPDRGPVGDRGPGGRDGGGREGGGRDRPRETGRPPGRGDGRPGGGGGPTQGPPRRDGRGPERGGDRGPGRGPDRGPSGGPDRGPGGGGRRDDRGGGGSGGGGAPGQRGGSRDGPRDGRGPSADRDRDRGRGPRGDGPGRDADRGGDRGGGRDGERGGERGGPNNRPGPDQPRQGDGRNTPPAAGSPEQPPPPPEE
jgi:cell fate regulator YaaT (PSP1 superfamily)